MNNSYPVMYSNQVAPPELPSTLYAVFDRSCIVGSELIKSRYVFLTESAAIEFLKNYREGEWFTDEHTLQEDEDVSSFTTIRKLDLVNNDYCTTGIGVHSAPQTVTGTIDYLTIGDDAGKFAEASELLKGARLTTVKGQLLFTPLIAPTGVHHGSMYQRARFTIPACPKVFAIYRIGEVIKCYETINNVTIAEHVHRPQVQVDTVFPEHRD